MAIPTHTYTKFDEKSIAVSFSFVKLLDPAEILSVPRITIKTIAPSGTVTLKPYLATVPLFIRVVNFVIDESLLPLLYPLL